MDGLRLAFYVSAAMSLIAAVASVLRGKQFFHEPHVSRAASTQVRDAVQGRSASAE
jgi:hypothetical protein